MTTPEEERAIADKILKRIEEEYGFVPLVNQVLSERPDLFIANANLGRTVLEGETKRLDRKTSYLIAMACATALGAEHCTRVQGTHAKEAGASREEILETMTIGSYMALNRSQSYGFRAFRDIFKDE